MSRAIVAAGIWMAAMLAFVGCQSTDRDKANDAWNDLTRTEQEGVCLSYYYLDDSDIIDLMMEGPDPLTRSEANTLLSVIADKC